MAAGKTEKLLFFAKCQTESTQSCVLDPVVLSKWRYAGLFFSLCVDMTDNDLAYLECIHLFVEILDHFFSNVCELDLDFNFHKVYLILDEFVLAGELQETSKKAIIERLNELEKLE
ncbi:PREDICTED: AP-2 complex subunit sigma-like [Ipomoea nil]|uniref:AP-2 complex subunit sigma-like n=1 Tax=Ipomoea nil TaxID=35883 RepID=UPI0009015D01|nr:PREDICTED: AP-2 complex subunit sigma-like [Ipomoea nil]